MLIFLPTPLEPTTTPHHTTPPPPLSYTHAQTPPTRPAHRLQPRIIDRTRGLNFMRAEDAGTLGTNRVHKLASNNDIRGAVKHHVHHHHFARSMRHNTRRQGASPITSRSTPSAACTSSRPSLIPPPVFIVPCFFFGVCAWECSSHMDMR